MRKENQVTETLEDTNSLLCTQSELKSSTMFSESPEKSFNKSRVARPSVSAPQSRTSSIRKVKTDSLGQTSKNIRRNSLPLDYDLTNIFPFHDGNFPQRTNSHETFQRVRSFKVTSKGLVNHGDSFRNKNRGRTLPSSGSFKLDKKQPLPSETSNDTDSYSSSANEYFRIAILGAHSVGKTTLMNQFMTSEYIGGQDDVSDNRASMNVSVLLDGEESSLEFWDAQVDHNVGESFFDAFIFVMSVDDVASFDTANDAMHRLRNDLGSDRPIILVANKIDLVRNRKVTSEEARQVANQHDAKYIETSVTLHHHVDELLVGIIRQIRLQLNGIIPTFVSFNSKKQKYIKGPRNFLKKILKLKRKSKESVENVIEY
ncbi:GTP-binding protein GEM-like [Saccostrea echinata]|uniref:GTP-binding protein GEM-like n=1 Tax=Saccostrea echinata TaxID=191078 RepID=UPI002A7EF3FC|nr:GTP-binding protein GEM-like [Saccostrea echinata]